MSNKIEFVDDFREVDLAFKEFLSGLEIDGKEVPVIYYSPDVDLTKETKPSIIFYRSEPFPDNSRWKFDKIRDNFVYDNNGKPIEVDERQPPEPWSLTYTVRTMYEFQEDGVYLNRFLFRRFPRGSVLIIKGIEYDITYFGGSLTGSGYKDFGKTKEGDKKLGETYNYRVDILLDIHERVTKKLTQTIGIETHQK